MIEGEGHNLAFILGLPRSGTTLLSVMLDKHPQVLTTALANAQKFVPNIQVGASEGSGIGGLLTALLGQALSTNTTPAAITGPSSR